MPSFKKKEKASMDEKVSDEHGTQAAKKVAAVTAFNMVKKQAGTRRISAMESASGTDTSRNFNRGTS